MVQKASTPWSTRTVAEGGTDSPVGDLVPIPDKITPVVNTGFISLSGKYRGIPASDLTFTFQDPNQALGAGANIFIDVNMMEHDVLIFAISDSSGNSINADLTYRLPATAQGPYDNPIFTSQGIAGTEVWHTNKNTSDGTLYEILRDTSTPLEANWQFYKVQDLKGTVGTIEIHNNDGSNAGTISTAFLRLV